MMKYMIKSFFYTPIECSFKDLTECIKAMKEKL